MVILRGHFMTSAWSLGVGGHTIMEIIGQMVAFKNPWIRPAISHKTMIPGWRSATQVRIADIAALMQALGPKLRVFFPPDEKVTLDIEIYWAVKDPSTQRHAILHSWLMTCCSFFSENIRGWNIFSDKVAAGGKMREEVASGIGHSDHVYITTGDRYIYLHEWLIFDDFV